MSKVIHTDKAKIHLQEEGIISIVFKRGNSIEPEDVRDVRNVNLEIANGKHYTVLIEAEELTSFSKEARELIASKEFAGITLAKALVIRNLGQRIIGNFYLHVNRPFIKTKLFTQKKRAIAWLREQLVEFHASNRASLEMEEVPDEE